MSIDKGHEKRGTKGDKIPSTPTKGVPLFSLHDLQDHFVGCIACQRQVAVHLYWKKIKEK